MEVSGRRLEITGEGNTEELEILCELCEADHVTTTANGTCRECEEYMCSSCFRQHLKAKSCRHHILIANSQSLTVVKRSVENVEKCKIHVNETIKFYCRKHETVGCGECMIPGHSACQPENIKDLSKGFQRNKDFKSLMGKLEELMAAINQNDKQIQENKKANQIMLKEALEEIDDFRTEINSYLDKAAASISMKAKYIEGENDTRLAKLEQECKLLPSKITEVTRKLDTGLYEDSALFIQAVNCKPHILDIERKVLQVQVQIENDFKTFGFIPDKQLNNYIETMQKFGNIANSGGKVGDKVEARDQSRDRKSGSTDLDLQNCEKNVKDIEGNLDRKHTLGGREVDEKAYTKCLDRQEGKKAQTIFHIQIETVLNDVDPQKLILIKRSSVNQLALEKQLDTCNTKISWSEEAGNILLKCRVTTFEKDGFKLVERCMKIAEKNFREFMRKIIVTKVFVKSDYFSEVMEQLKTVTIDNPDSVAVFVHRFEGIIIVVGMNPVAESLSRRIYEINKQVMVAGQRVRSKNTK